MQLWNEEGNEFASVMEGERKNGKGGGERGKRKYTLEREIRRKLVRKTRQS